MSTVQRGLYGSDPSLLSPVAAKALASGKLKWLIAVTASLGAILEVIDLSIVNVALPDIQGNLGATLSEAGWVSTGYSCANVIMIPLTAWLSDRFGRKNYLLFSLIGFTLSSALCGIAPNLMVLVVARIFQGLAGGGLLAKAQALLFETFPREQQPQAQSMFGIGVIAGPALGPVLGGYLTDTIGWRWIFFVNLPVGLIAVVMAIIFLPRDRPEDIKHSTVDWAGIGFLVLGLGCFQTMLEEGQQDDWFSSDFIVTMALGSVIGIGLFIWRELTAKSPAVDLRVLRYRTLAAGSVYSLVLGMGIYGVIFAVPIFVQSFLHFTATQSGILQIVPALGAAVMMIVLGKVSGRYDARILVAMGALTTVAAAFFLSNINPSTSSGTLFLPLLLRSLGSVLMFLPLSLATLGDLPKHKVSAGAGFYNLTRQLGSSIGIAVITLLLSHYEAIHRAILVERVTLFNPASVRRLELLGGAFAHRSGDSVGAHQQALKAVDGIISAQSVLLSFADVFFYVGVVFFLTLPLLLFLGQGKNKAAAAEVH